MRAAAAPAGAVVANFPRVVIVNLGAGRLVAARRAAGLLEETVEGLTPHHRLHGIAVAPEEEPLLSDAASRFEAMGLDWHAGETRKLLS